MNDKNLKKGNKKTQFSSENQPSAKAKSEGIKKKYLLKDISNQLLQGDSKKAMESLAEYMGVDVDRIDVELAMHLKMMERALKEGDVKAYNSVMDRIKGKPVQAITMEELNIKATKYINATGNS